MLSIHESDWDTLDKSLQLKEAALDALRHFLEQGDTPEEIVERITGERPLKAFQPITTLQMMGSFAQFERSMIHKRQAEGIALAKAKGENSPYKGRKASVDRSVITDMVNAGSSVTAISRALNISRQSVYRIKDEVA